MQYIFFEKGIAVYNGKAPEAGECSRIFVLEVTLQCVRLILTVSYRKMAPPASAPMDSNSRHMVLPINVCDI